MTTRKAVSPVIATVILIAITLIAAIAVAGFIFGTFGSFENVPEVSASSSLSSQNGLSGSVTLYNSGNSPATVMGLTLTYAGQTCTAVYSSSSPTVGPSGSLALSIQAGTFNFSNSYDCGQVGTPSVAQAGMAYTGQVALAGGAQVPITGIFQ